MAVRKRTWISGGKEKQKWIAEWADQNGKPHIKTFRTEKEAKVYEAQVKVDVVQGVHTPEHGSRTVAEAAQRWLEGRRLAQRQRGTLRGYEVSVRLRIARILGHVKLPLLTKGRVAGFRDQLLKEGVAHDKTRETLAHLRAILGEAQERGDVAVNVAIGVRVDAQRDKGKLKIGIDVPTKEEAGKILAYAPARWQPLFAVLIFAGLRVSEARGLPWANVDLEEGVIRVRQRADEWKQLGPPKTAASERDIPIPPTLINILRSWMAVCPREGVVETRFPTSAANARSILTHLRANPQASDLQLVKLLHRSSNSIRAVRRDAGITPFPKGRNWQPKELVRVVETAAEDEPLPPSEELGFVFPERKGGVISHTSIHVAFRETQIEAGIVGADGGKKYKLHSLRHFFASLCIEQFGISDAKLLSELLGHTSTTMTWDRYGHWFPKGEEVRTKIELAVATVVGHSTPEAPRLTYVEPTKTAEKPTRVA
jgi:integrase